MKATHSGTCQICGSRQLLPGGTLSNHGYTVKWGFFSGICTGAGHLPFELSKDLIEPRIALMEAEIAKVAEEIAQWRDINSERNGGSQAWIRVYTDHIGYNWQLKTLQLNEKKTQDGSYTWVDCEYEDGKSKTGEPKMHRIQRPYDIKVDTMREWAHYLNCKYADHLAAQNSQRRDWVTWQQGRLANWAPQPLKARGEK